MSDPLSITSFGLGVASLAIQMLEGVKKGYRYFEAAADLNGECESFRLRLRIEYTRLLDWADVAGLSSEADHQNFNGNLRMNRAVVMALLGEISALLTNMRHSGLRSIAEDLSETQEPKESVGKRDLQEFDPTFDAARLPEEPPKHHKGLNHVLKLRTGIRAIASDPKRRMIWAIRDRERFIENLRRLRELTNYLHETVGEHKMGLLLQSASETQLAMVQLTTTVDEMKDLLQAMRDATSSRPDDAGSLRSESSTIAVPELDDAMLLQTAGGDALFGQLTSFRIKSLDVKKRAEANGLDYLRVEDTEVNFGATDVEFVGNRALATFKDERVWVEWKKVSMGIFEDESGMPMSGIRCEGTIQYLAALLRDEYAPQEFRVPRCLCYFLDEENERVGLVFRYPKTVFPSSRPITLRQLFDNGAPALRSKVSMAKHLASSLLYLHCVNWLHKSLNSTSVTFFRSDDHVQWDNLCISAFEHARLDEGITITGPYNDPGLSQLYWHPDYAGERKHVFRKTYDIYSLGILLLEIALWQPASHIFSVTEPAQINVRTLEGIRDGILGKEHWLEDVRSAMGDLYCDATRACIEGLKSFKIDPEADEADPVIGAMIQQGFLFLVVRVLNGIVV